MNAITTMEPKRSVLVDMSKRYGMEPAAFEATLRATVVPEKASREQFAAFLLVAKEYGLNPITKEIYAFPTKGGGIQPIVGIDGWMNLINSQPQCDGLEFDDQFDTKGELSAITCRIYRKDRSRPTSVTEYMLECKRPTEPWQKWPARMLRHKAAIQCARYAFGFAGIIDPEEAERSPDVITNAVVAPPPQQIAMQRTTEGIEVITADGVVVHAVQEAEVDDATDTPVEPFDATTFFERLEEALAGAMDEPTVAEVWDSFDVEATFDGDDINRAIADKIKQRRLKQIGG